MGFRHAIEVILFIITVVKHNVAGSLQFGVTSEELPFSQLHSSLQKLAKLDVHFLVLYFDIFSRLLQHGSIFFIG